ncbi:MAG: hypothetical protein NT007_07845 [Candidatus Kapabacteria bacterium]|nr:hypothetical protein [Candidatus Kapabacteria bacterium]
MKIKKFTANSFKEGKARIFSELGDDAVVISTRSILRSDGQEMVEIVAAIDENHPDSYSEDPPSVAAPENLQQSYLPKKSETNNSFSDTGSRIYNEIVDMKSQLRYLSDLVKNRQIASLNPILLSLFDKMSSNGFSESDALNYVSLLNTQNPNITEKTAIGVLLETLQEDINILAPFQKTGSRMICAFIGPTGSGKTTSLVKLAIICKIVLKSSVLIVSADNIKVGANEQLESFASYGGISFRQASNIKDIKIVLDTEKHRDFIFIDTNGRSYKDSNGILELAPLLDTCSPDMTYLCIQANYSSQSIEAIYRGFRKLKPNAIILTKLDETEKFGHLLTVFKNIAVPIAYTSSGQRIPEDIEPASREKLAEIMVNG